MSTLSLISINFLGGTISTIALVAIKVSGIALSYNERSSILTPNRLNILITLPFLHFFSRTPGHICYGNENCQYCFSCKKRLLLPEIMVNKVTIRDFCLSLFDRDGDDLFICDKCNVYTLSEVRKDKGTQ